YFPLSSGNGIESGPVGAWSSSMLFWYTRLVRGQGCIMLPFETSEYLERIAKTKKRMAERGIEVLLVVDPANMNYLTGYNGWAFYTPQAIKFSEARAHPLSFLRAMWLSEALAEPLFIVRGMDANGAKVTTFLKHENIIGYPDHYVQSPVRHAMDYVADMLKERKLDKARIGLEMDSYYFTPLAYEALKRNLPNAK